MARNGVPKTMMLLLRAPKPVVPVGRCMSELAKVDHAADKRREWINGDRQLADPSSCWMPHPRTGIYFPEGHDSVMDGVPDGAASFDQIYWLRNVDGVDKPDPHAHAPPSLD